MSEVATALAREARENLRRIKEKEDARAAAESEQDRHLRAVHPHSHPEPARSSWSIGGSRPLGSGPEFAASLDPNGTVTGGAILFSGSRTNRAVNGAAKDVVGLEMDKDRSRVHRVQDNRWSSAEVANPPAGKPKYEFSLLRGGFHPT
mmetsp:Transcript_51002/g.102292  ORF Transcript_51002/g.102292 Transcript_51002/m.102292 type:complete len:148 (-) Transcript_51002:326-769(-)